MDLNTIRINLSSLLLCFFIACTGTNQKQGNKKPETKKDTCKLDLYVGSNIELSLGCGNCHKLMGDRVASKIPTYLELSKIDSLKLKEFIFKTKHKNMYPEYYKVKRLDTLSECEIRNLMHYIKNFGRGIPKI